MPKIIDKKLVSSVAFQIKRLREAQGLTQEEFFNDTGIHIGRLETGKYDITITTLKRLCKYFNLNLSEFFLAIKQ